MKRLGLVMLAVASLGVSGCASVLNVGEEDFNCPGATGAGVACMSARDVYKATHASDRVAPTHIAGRPIEPDKDQSAQDKALPQMGAAGGEPTPAAVPTIDKPVPIRTQAKVLRVWVAPFEDEAGDLHVPGYVFTEISPRRWNLGDGLVKKTNMISPLAGAMGGKMPGPLTVNVSPGAADPVPSSQMGGTPQAQGGGPRMGLPAMANPKGR